MIETLQAYFTEPRLAVAAAMLALGVVFGALSESSQFCLQGGVREARQGEGAGRLRAFFAGALAALAITQGLVAAGALDLSGAMQLTAAAAAPAIAIGGFLFGVGAALTRGCAGRLTILAATGNLRALVVIIVVGLFGYMAMRGLLAPARLALEGFVRPAGPTPDLASLAGWGASGRFALAGAALAGALWLAARAGGWRGLGALLIGAVVAATWAASAWLGDDGFDKLAPWAPSFIAPLGNGLVFLLTYTGARVDAGAAFIAGVLLGAFVSAQAGGRARLVSFETPRQTVRYLAGGALMGFGGVMALGCSTGQGLSGVSTLAPASFLALASIIAGVWAGVAMDARTAPAKA